MTGTAANLLAEIKDEERARATWQSVFRPSAQTGRENSDFVLAAIAVRCGVYETDPEKLRPELIALWHWLLGELGVRHELNIIPEAHALTELANNEDLRAAGKRIVRTEKELEGEETE